MLNWDFSAMTKNRKEKDERLFATKENTEPSAGRKLFLAEIIPNVFYIFLLC